MNSKQAIEDHLLKTVENTISMYKMFPDTNNPVFVAFSGGKDSLVTMLLLSKLGYRVYALTVNTGDELFNINSLQEREFPFKVEVLEARSILNFSALTDKEKEELVWRLQYLDSLPKDSNLCCTHCYFVKMYTLYGDVKSRGGTAIVLGQHKDDMIDSLLKCYWADKYYNIVTKIEGLPYDGARMIDLMKKCQEIDLEYLRLMVKKELAATDEPFVEDNTLPDMLVVRPLGAISERDIVSYMNFFSLKPAKEGCVFKNNWSDTTKAFRLIVHEDYLRRVHLQPQLEEKLFELVLSGLSSRGTWLFRPRNSRHKNYPGFKTYIKKL